jgi:hypothetical protein
MAPGFSKKRKLDDRLKAQPKRPSKKVRKQQAYDSGSSSPSDDEFDAVDLASSGDEAEEDATKPVHPSRKSILKKGQRSIKTLVEKERGEAEGEDDGAADSESEHSTNASDSEAESDDNLSDESDNPNLTKVTKRNDPAAFSNSLTAILSSKLSNSKRSDPVLARSKDAALAAHELAESKLELKARRKIREEKRAFSEKGRVKDVLLGDRKPAVLLREGDEAGAEAELVNGEMTAAQIMEQERRLRKTAQRGVVKLFNAVRAAQVKGEEAAREAGKKGIVGTKRKDEKIAEMGRQAFLDLVGGGGV